MFLIFTHRDLVPVGLSMIATLTSRGSSFCCVVVVPLSSDEFNPGRGLHSVFERLCSVQVRLGTADTPFWQHSGVFSEECR